MTDEELKKEAIKFAVGYPTSYGKGYKHKDLRIAYLAGAEPREKRIEELETQIEQLQKINSEQKETLKKVRIALIQERTANIVNYGKGGVEMFDDMLEVLKGVSN